MERSDNGFYVGDIHLDSVTRNFSVIDSAQIPTAIGIWIVKSVVSKVAKAL